MHSEKTGAAPTCSPAPACLNHPDGAAGMNRDSRPVSPGQRRPADPQPTGGAGKGGFRLAKETHAGAIQPWFQ